MENLSYEERKLALIEEITVAFDGVSREDGLTWAEATVIDNYGSPEERAKARQKDLETRWQDVPDYKMSRGDAVLSFLNAKGFYYYLPAYLVWYLNYLDSDDPEADSNTFDSVIYHLANEYSVLAEDNGLSPFDLMTSEQNKAVARFLEFDANRHAGDEKFKAWETARLLKEGWTQDEVNESWNSGFGPNLAQIALDRYWGQFLNPTK